MHALELIERLDPTKIQCEWCLRFRDRDDIVKIGIHIECQDVKDCTRALYGNQGNNKSLRPDKG